MTLINLLANIFHLLLKLADFLLVLPSKILHLADENFESLEHTLVHMLLVDGEVLLGLPVFLVQLLRQLESLSLDLLGLRSDIIRLG